jgi:hypothetical protein
MDDQAGGDDWESVPVKGKKGKGGVKSADKKSAGILHNLPIAPGMSLDPFLSFHYAISHDLSILISLPTEFTLALHQYMDASMEGRVRAQ